MKKTLGYLIAFGLIFIGLQIWPITEGNFSGYTPWDILLFTLACARESLFADISVTGCAEISDISVAVALGQIVGDALFVGFILLIFYLVQRRTSRKKAESEANHST